MSNQGDRLYIGVAPIASFLLRADAIERWFRQPVGECH